MFTTEKELFEQFGLIEGGSGTRIVIYNLKKGNDDSTFELDFETDLDDILISQTKEDGNSVGGEDDSKGNQELPLYQQSLREYCSILFLNSRMRIFIREKIVKEKRLHRNLIKRRLENYKPKDQRKTIAMTFGRWNQERQRIDQDYGALFYYKNRLIKAYEKVGCQKKNEGIGVIAIVEIPPDIEHIVPIHNKQDFLQSNRFRSMTNELSKKMNAYCQQDSRSELINDGEFESSMTLRLSQTPKQRKRAKSAQHGELNQKISEGIPESSKTPDNDSCLSSSLISPPTASLDTAPLTSPPLLPPSTNSAPIIFSPLPNLSDLAPSFLSSLPPPIKPAPVNFSPLLHPSNPVHMTPTPLIFPPTNPAPKTFSFLPPPPSTNPDPLTFPSLPNPSNPARSILSPLPPPSNLPPLTIPPGPSNPVPLNVLPFSNPASMTVSTPSPSSISVLLDSPSSPLSPSILSPSSSWTDLLVTQQPPNSVTSNQYTDNHTTTPEPLTIKPDNSTPNDAYNSQNNTEDFKNHWQAPVGESGLLQTGCSITTATTNNFKLPNQLQLKIEPITSEYESIGTIHPKSSSPPVSTIVKSEKLKYREVAETGVQTDGGVREERMEEVEMQLLCLRLNVAKLLKSLHPEFTYNQPEEIDSIFNDFVETNSADDIEPVHESTSQQQVQQNAISTPENRVNQIHPPNNSEAQDSPAMKRQRLS